jgi:hypothetical protein
MNVFSVVNISCCCQVIEENHWWNMYGQVVQVDDVSP